jgi:hypothetical protein
MAEACTVYEETGKILELSGRTLQRKIILRILRQK